MTNQQTLYLEATLEAAGAKTGREWDVTIIGAKDPADLVTVEGAEYIRSKNGRLYSVSAIAESVDLWDGVKVYDNHLTQAEFEQKQGMRSPAREWLGTIVKPYFDTKAKQLRGVFKVVEESVATKLKNAYESDVLGSIGLSIDTFPIIGKEAMYEGVSMPIIEGFKKILSVDLVGDPAAGGGFNRLLASQQFTQENTTMDETKVKEMIDGALTALDIKGQVTAALAEALSADDDNLAEMEMPVEDEEEMDGKKKKKPVEDEEEMEESVINRQLEAIRLEQAALTLENRLLVAKLDSKHEELVRQAFAGRIFEKEELEKMIRTAKEAQAASDDSGRVTESGNGRISVGLNEDDKFGLEFARLVMGNRLFNELARNEPNDDLVAPRLKEASFWQAWKRNDQRSVESFNRLSTLIEAYLGGNPVIDGRALEAATTSSLATVVKNTVNIMVAADYSQQERWYEPIVVTEEVDTIDDSTLARLYGISNLPVVSEGAAYTELATQDEEETASFVKNGGYVAVTMETLMRDKVNFVRSIPKRMSNAWYNTLSAYTSAVFTANSSAGPVLSDTGALFNNTAATSAGGHANLLTTALSYAAFSAARTAMRKQTDQPLGVGRRLQINPAFLLVPDDLETTALQIRNSELVPSQDGGGTSNGQMQTANQFYQKFEVVVVPDWTDTTDWALVANPQQFPAIYHIFPRGARTPQLFTADSEVTGAMFTNDVMRFKVRMLTFRYSSTYSCSPVADFRPLHKSNV